MALVVAVCAVSDLVLIVLGVAGIGVVIEQAPAAVEAVRWAGAAFLAVYGCLATWRAVRGQAAGQLGTGQAASWMAVLGAGLAFTWLNPHVYLDTVVLLGSIANTHAGAEWWFAAGAAVGSAAWFSGLGFGARLLRPVFARPAAWRVLDGVIAVVMTALAATLVVGGMT